jgi:hypothetical protein
MRLTLANEGDRLRGIDLDLGTILVESTRLIGTQIEVDVGSHRYAILIEDVRPSNLGDGEHFWVPDASMQMPSIETYVFRYQPLPLSVNQPWRPLCSEGDGDPSKLTALVFGGDLYDPVSKEITIGPSTQDWIDIACADSAPFKMHKIGYTTAGQERLGMATTLAQRRAMLNAWTANVCGTGEAFTVQGEPITLSESLGVFQHEEYSRPSASIEAIWDERGAVCLNIPRRLDSDAAIYDKIRDKCDQPPRCNDLLDDWTNHFYVLTGNPEGS